jgi:valyl-tRNA synthetase
MLGFLILKKLKKINMKNNFLIDTPPPTISGSAGLHIGHIFSYTQGDLIAQYKKYRGKELIYPFCFDSNGIPTGKLASSKNIKGTENIINFAIERSKIYKDIFDKSGIEFANHSYHTYDQLSIDICYQAFEILKSKGIAYKKTTEYLWSEKLKTSISQSELDDNGIIERTGETPIIKIGEGWFINLKDHIPQIKSMIDKIDWKPFKFKKRIDDWCDGLQWDWSISRERNFGIPIPGESSYTFDTWFISSLSPQIAWSSYKGYNDMLNCPIFDMRFQSHDIIRTWAFYTIAMSYFINGQIPWKTLMITGHTLDGNGDKFSKSSGNATPPLPLIEKYGISGIRHWSLSNTLGTDTKIDEEKMKMGWKILNKLKNADKFIKMQIDNNWIGEDDSYYMEWKEIESSIYKFLDDYEIDKATDILYKFFWDKFCSIWIEESKKSPTSITLNKILIEIKSIYDFILIK